MSRGYGKHERRILEAVTHGYVWLATLVPDTRSAEYKALHRAALTLEAKGEIQVWRWNYGRRRVLVGSKTAPSPPKRPEGYQ